MYKTTAVVEPHIIEPETIVLETKTGKKIEIFNGLDPYKWIDAEHKRLKSEIKDTWSEMFIICLSCIVVATLMYFLTDKIWTIVIFITIVTLAIVIFIKKYILVRKELTKFEADMKENKLQPNMLKSLAYYNYRNWHSYYVVERLLSLSEKIFVDYEIIKNEDGQYSLTIMEADKYGTGDIQTWTCSPEVIHNMDLKYPQISTKPWGVFLRIPMDINKTGEADNQVQLTHED